MSGLHRIFFYLGKHVHIYVSVSGCCLKRWPINLDNLQTFFFLLIVRIRFYLSLKIIGQPRRH